MHIIAGKHKKRGLVAPSSTEVRPTLAVTRETVFNICQMHIDGARFLDVFAGSGAMGFEALSRGASRATFIEQNRLSLQAIKKNSLTLKEEMHTEILALDALKALILLSNKERVFDLIYVDPPYGKGWGIRILDFLDSHPELLAKEGFLFIEELSFEEKIYTHFELNSRRRIGKADLFVYHRKRIA